MGIYIKLAKKYPLYIDICSVLLICVALTCFAFLTGPPMDSDFFWPDASRHAMDGAFWYDFFREKAFIDPVIFTFNYYTHSPAIAPIMYPPGFALIEGAVFSVLGVSVVAARITEALFFCAMLIGMYLVANQCLGRLESYLAVFLLASCPGILYWGRQVMLEVPALAFMLFGIYSLIKFLKEDWTPGIWLALVFGLAAFYTKQQALVIAGIYLSAIFLVHGMRGIFSKKILFCAFLFLVAILPLILLSYKYTLNFSQALGRYPVSSLDNLLDILSFYPRNLPNQIGIMNLLLACTGVVLGTWRAIKRKEREFPLFFAVSWILVNYGFITLIRHYEVRYAFFWIPAFVLLSIYCLATLRRFLEKELGFFYALWPSIIIFLCILATGIIFFDGPVRAYRTGMDRVAKCVLENRKGPSILLHVHDDGNLIFRLREISPHNNRYVFRALKLFASNFYGPEWGIKEKVRDEQAIKSELDKLGVSIVVIQRNFCPRTKVSSLLKKILDEGNAYDHIGTFPLSNHNGVYATIDVFASKKERHMSAHTVRMFLPSARLYEKFFRLN